MQKRIVALDVGDRRIGIAVSDPLGITAQPIETYTRVGYGPDVRHIASIAAKYETDQILCGLPRNMDGTQGFQVEKVREFAAKLTEAGLSVEFYDERLTTVLAEGALLEGGLSRADRKKRVDMVAAVMILESYMDAKRMAQSSAPEEETQMEQEDGSILEMEDEDGGVIRFELSAKINYKDEQYVLLEAVEDAGDIAAGETFIMLETKDDDGNVCYQSIDDEALIDAVYDAHLREAEED